VPAAGRTALPLGNIGAVSSRLCCTHGPPSELSLSPLSVPSLVLPPSIPFRTRRTLLRSLNHRGAGVPGPLPTSPLLCRSARFLRLPGAGVPESRPKVKMGERGEGVPSTAMNAVVRTWWWWRKSPKRHVRSALLHHPATASDRHLVTSRLPLRRRVPRGSLDQARTGDTPSTTIERKGVPLA
jgi:hypothetical protein